MRDLIVLLLTGNVLVLVYFSFFSKLQIYPLMKRSPVKTTTWKQVPEVDGELLKTLQKLFPNKERDEVQSTAGYHGNSLSDGKKALFSKRISTSDRTMFRKLLKDFSQSLPDITYFLYGGSLLGSYRHHGMIPWDDDVDLIVRAKDKPSLLKIFKSLETEYSCYLGNIWWKLFPRQSQEISQYPWKWPFLDIFFYTENQTHIVMRTTTDLFASKTDIFPLISRPFMDMMLPAPKNTSGFLELFYNTSTCCTNAYDHKRERFLQHEPVCVSCHHLVHMFPFVNRKFHKATTFEILEGGHVDSLHGKVYISDESKP